MGSLQQVNNLDIWKLIPPEEKLALLSKSHAKGVLTSLMCVIIASTCAVALQEPWLLWSSLLAVPFVYNFTSSKAWRHLKPSIVLSYLAARSAARRYAFSKRASDLNCALMFRGTLERIYSDDDAQEALEAIIEKNKINEVWIALFRDTIVMLSEQPGGAKLEFGHQLNDKLTVEAFSASGEDYASDKELIFSHPEDEDADPLVNINKGRQRRYRLTSRYPAALVAFEKKIEEHRKLNKELSEKAIQSIVATQGGGSFFEDDDGLF